MNAGSGRTSSAPFVTYDRASCSWRTLLLSLFEDLPASPPTWPRSGTWDLGAAYELPTSAPLTGASGSSSSPGLPTPTANISGRTGEQHMAMRHGIGRNTPSQLEAAVQLLPTPRASERDSVNKTGVRTPPEAAAKRGWALGEALNLLPTPSVADGMGGHLSRSGERGNELLLPGVAKAISSGSLLPTPTAMDSHGARNATANRSAVKAGTNNDGWTLSDVFWTGDYTPRPSAAGKPSPAGPPPGQLSLDEPESA